MKKVFSIVLLGFVMLAGSRMSINLHYCGGELASVEFFATMKDTCGKCGMKKSKTCCQDVSKILSSEEHQLSTFSFDFAAPLAIVPFDIFSLFLKVSFPNTEINNTAWANAPPPAIHKEPLYILHRTLIV